MDTKETDPVIIDLLKWFEDNLPAESQEDIFKEVRKVQKVFDLIMSMVFERLYASHPRLTPEIEDEINSKLEEIKEMIVVSEEREQRAKKLEKSRAKLDLKKGQYNIVTSIKLDSCMDLISRYNHLMGKK